MRGVAILGILLLNIVGFAWPDVVTISPRAPTAPLGADDDAVYLAQFVLAEGKFRGMFTLLFGASLILFVERADAAGHDGEALQRRRLGWLALFGLAHFYLMWWGDILFLYAVCGLFALAVRHWRPRALTAAALVLYCAGALILGGLSALAALPWLGGPADPALADQLVADYARQAQAEIAIRRGGWPGEVAHAFGTAWSDPLVMVALSWFETVPLMLIGMALFKAGFFAGTWNPARLRRWAIGGIAAALVLTVPLAWWLWREQFALALTLFVWLGPAAAGRLAGTIGYIALFTLLARSCAGGTLGRRVVACGRMAFSNYIGTSMVMTFIFHGWGLGLYATQGRVALLGFVVLGWVLMLAWSKPWLDRFRHGPLEWAWRSLTYRRIEPFKR